MHLPVARDKRMFWHYKISGMSLFIDNLICNEADPSRQEKTGKQLDSVCNSLDPVTVGQLYVCAPSAPERWHFIFSRSPFS
jgi:hypothetical protein